MLPEDTEGLSVLSVPISSGLACCLANSRHQILTNSLWPRFQIKAEVGKVQDSEKACLTRTNNEIRLLITMMIVKQGWQWPYQKTTYVERTMSYNFLVYITYLWGLMLLAFTSSRRSDLFLLKQIAQEGTEEQWCYSQACLLLSLSSRRTCGREARAGRGVSTLQIWKQHRWTQRAHVFLLVLIGGINSHWQFPGASASPKRLLPV